MAVQTKKIGAILGMLGSTIFLITGLFSISRFRPYYDPSFPLFLPYITGGATIALSVWGIVGSVFVFRDTPTAGYIILLTAATLGIFGTFFPIFAYDEGWGYIQIFYLCNTAIYSDLVLMLVGGLLGFALVDNRERQEY